jgi:hypothetical protein
MMEMKDLPYTDEWQEITLAEDLLLDDRGFSNKELQVANKGETILIKETPNYGIVKHPVHGFFRH